MIDGITAWDQLTFFLPPSLWTEEVTPMAAVMPDIDSFDPFATLAYNNAPPKSVIVAFMRPKMTGHCATVNVCSP